MIKEIFILGGANGSGKSTFAVDMLVTDWECFEIFSQNLDSYERD